MNPKLGVLIALLLYPSRIADSSLLPTLSPQYDAGKWYVQAIVSPNDADVRIIESTIVERQNAVSILLMLWTHCVRKSI